MTRDTNTRARSTYHRFVTATPFVTYDMPATTRRRDDLTGVDEVTPCNLRVTRRAGVH